MALTDADKISIFLENCRMPSVVTGSFVDLEPCEMPLVGITGFSDEFQRGEKRNCWVVGEIISPTFIGNNSCACKSHIEGIVTDTGELHFLEQVCDFMAHEGDCYEYTMKSKDGIVVTTPVLFEGSVTARMIRNRFRPKNEGKATLQINPHWQKDECGSSKNYSMTYGTRHHVMGDYIPKFWSQFLAQIEGSGYEHPYVAVTSGLMREREKNSRLPFKVS